MAEQTIRYRVELDDADLAQQLESIRSKLNSQVSSLAPAVPSSAAFDASQIYSAPLNFTPPALPAEGSYPVIAAPTPSFQAFDNANTGFASIKQDYQSATTGFQQFKGDVNSTFEFLGGAGQNFNSGFQMMKNDLNLSPVTTPDPGFMQSAAGAFGIGYDPRMPMYKSDYQSYYGNNVAETLKDVVSTTAEIGTGFALPALGVAAGMSAGAAAGLIAAPLAILGGIGAIQAYQEKSLEESGMAFQELMLPTIKNATVNQGISVASSVEAFSDSDYAKTMDIAMVDIKDAIGAFASSGGYTNTVNVEQFRQKTQEMLENFRGVMHALGMAQEEAAAMMGELEAKKIATPSTMGSFVAGLQVRSEAVGLAPTDLLATGFQATELLKSFGYSPAAAFDFGIDATIEAQRLANSADPYYKNAIYTMGGVQNAAQSLMQNTTAYDNTSLGSADLGANYATGDTPTDVQDVMDTNAALFTDPNQYFKFSYNKRKVAEKIDFTAKSQNMLSKTLDVMKKAGLDTSDKEVVTAFMSSFMKGQGVDMSIDEASLIIGSAMNVEDPDETLKKVRGREMFNLMKETDPKFWDVVGTKVGNAVGGVWDFTKEFFRPVGDPIAEVAIAGYKAADSFGDWFVNDLIEDGLVSSVTGKKFFHHEDYKDVTKEQLQNIGNYKLFKELGFIKTTGNEYKYSGKDLDGIYSNIRHLGEIDSKSSDKKSSRIDALTKFSNSDIDDVLRFIPKLFGEEKITQRSKLYEKYDENQRKGLAEDMGAVIDYIDDVMYETREDGSKFRTTDFKYAKENLIFSKYLNDRGVMKNIKEKPDKNSSYNADMFTKELGDFNYDYNMQDSAENLYNAVSSRVFKKTFKSLTEDEQANLTRYVNSESGRKVIKWDEKFVNYEAYGLPEEGSKNKDFFDNFDKIDTSSNKAYLQAKQDETFSGDFAKLTKEYTEAYKGRANAQQQVEYSIGKVYNDLITNPTDTKVLQVSGTGAAGAGGGVTYSVEQKRKVDSKIGHIDKAQAETLDAWQTSSYLDVTISEVDNEKLLDMDFKSIYGKLEKEKDPLNRLKIISDAVENSGITIPKDYKGNKQAYLLNVARNSKNSYIKKEVNESGKKVDGNFEAIEKDENIDIENSEFVQSATSGISKAYDTLKMKEWDGTGSYYNFNPLTKILNNQIRQEFKITSNPNADVTSRVMDSDEVDEQSGVTGMGDNLKNIGKIVNKIGSLASNGITLEEMMTMGQEVKKLEKEGVAGKRVTDTINKELKFEGLDGKSYNLSNAVDITRAAEITKEWGVDLNKLEGNKGVFMQQLAMEIGVAQKEGKDFTIHDVGLGKAENQKLINAADQEFSQYGGVAKALVSEDKAVQTKAREYMADKREQVLKSQTFMSQFWDTEGDENKRELVRKGIKAENEKESKEGKAAKKSDDEIAKEAEAYVEAMKQSASEEAATKFNTGEWQKVPGILEAVKTSLAKIAEK